RLSNLSLWEGKGKPGQPFTRSPGREVRNVRRRANRSGTGVRAGKPRKKEERGQPVVCKTGRIGNKVHHTLYYTPSEAFRQCQNIMSVESSSYPMASLRQYAPLLPSVAPISLELFR